MDMWRQLDIFNPDNFKDPIHVIGCGGIGSPATLCLAKMGLTDITVYDDDTIEDHNLPNQMYRLGDIGKTKVSALQEIGGAYSGAEIKAVPERFDHAVSGVVISGVDSMASRKAIWERVKYKPQIKYYMEARMGGEIARIHTVMTCDPQHVDWYEGTLYSDEDAVEAPCTARAIMYNVFVIAGLMCAQVKKIADGDMPAKEILLDLKNMMLLTEE